MDALGDAFDAVERRHRTLEVYTDDDALVSELEAQFSTRNVEVARRSATAVDGGGAVVVRDADGEFRAGLGVDHLRAIASPEIHPPWALDAAEPDYAEIFDFLDNAIFASYDRRQMLATTREIEGRAWRVGEGTLYAGFQRSAAFAAQTTVYERSLAIRLFVEDEWSAALPDAVDVVSGAGDEIGQFWFVLFDGGGSDMQKCGLLAEEREPDRYRGFWTYDPEIVDELMEYLQTTYGGG